MSKQAKLSCLIFSAFMIVSQPSHALEFEPGIGAGSTFTDNAGLEADNQQDDVIVSSSVSAKLKSNEGPLAVDVATSLSKHNYTKGTFDNQRYFYLNMDADWEMIKDRFSWFLTENFTQRSIRSINTVTPDNLQDTNAIVLGAKINSSITGRQYVDIVPTVSQYYFERQRTNSRQYSVLFNWGYRLHKLRNIGLSLSTREIDYSEQVIQDTRFTTLGVTFNAATPSSSYDINLGSTYVSRDGGASTQGFSGSLNWLFDLSSRSSLNTVISTELTDTGSSSFNAIGGDDIQVTSDVIRNSRFNVTYARDDALLHSSLLASYQKTTYSESPLDREVKTLLANVRYPATPRLSVGSYLRYSQTEQLNTLRKDDRYSIGGNVTYNFTQKIKGFFDISYRKKDSTTASQNFDEANVYLGLSYGFGGSPRPQSGF